MTHITEDIRLDGLKFLRIWVDLYPSLVVTYADKVLMFSKSNWPHKRMLTMHSDHSELLVSSVFRCEEVGIVRLVIYLS